MRHLGVIARLCLTAGVLLAVGAAGTTTSAPKDLVLDLGGSVKMRCVRIEAGEFLMGSPAGEKGRTGGETPHKVRITKPFYLGVYEVTQEQYEAVMGRNPSDVKAPKDPVNSVSWNDATEFCRKLSEKTGKTVRLPTEAEWEYACRAGTTTAYQWGDDPDKGEGWCNGSDLTSKEKDQYTGPGFHWRDGFAKVAPVGSLKPNAWGLYDMHGNVCEWCQDWYGERDQAETPAADPMGPEKGENRIYRGGSWLSIPAACRSAYRLSETPHYRNYVIGFRVAVDVP